MLNLSRIFCFSHRFELETEIEIELGNDHSVQYY